MMKKRIFLVILSLFACTCIFAQTADVAKAESIIDTVKVEPAWKISGATSLNFVESSFSNWASGGENSVAGTAAVAVKALYHKNKITWETNVAMAYGLTFLDGEKRKNDDKIDFLSKFGYRAAKHWDYSALVSLKTQFDKGYSSYPITDGSAYNSKFFAPAYVMTALGMDYRPCPDFSLFLSPFTGKYTFMLDNYLSDLGAFGVDPGDNIYLAYGAYVKATYTKKLHQNILLATTLDLFSDFLESPQNVAINWELTLDMKVTKYLSAKLYTQLVYDDKVKMINDDGTTSGPKLQFKQVLGVGFSYIF